MKNLNESHSNAGQSTTVVKKSQKHDTNLQKNSTLYFQVGLILCLLGTFALFEMQFKHVVFEDKGTAYAEEAPIEFHQKFRIYQEEKVVEKKKTVEKQIIKDKIKEVPDDHELKEAAEAITSEQNVTNDAPKLDGPIEDPKEVTDDVPVPFVFIEKVPIYPGCEKEKTNDARRKCMSKKIEKLVKKKFNTDIAIDNGLSGRQKIYVEFKIDKTGNVIDIKTRAPHPQLEKEAQRVINKIPTMQPGYQRDKPVNVVYNIPIVFDVRD